MAWLGLFKSKLTMSGMSGLPEKRNTNATERFPKGEKHSTQQHLNFTNTTLEQEYSAGIEQRSEQDVVLQ